MTRPASRTPWPARNPCYDSAALHPERPLDDPHAVTRVLHPALRHVTGFWIFVAYSLLTIGLTWPLVLHVPNGVAHDLGDPLLTTWLVWWNAAHVPFTTTWWNAPAFFPTEGVMAFSENLVGLALVTSPIVWITGNPQLAHNVAFLLTFLLSAWFAYLLCYDLTGRRDAAFFGGLFFGFTPVRISQMPHIQVLATFWMPLALLGLHRYLRTERVGWVVLFAAAWLLQALSNSYMIVFFSLVVGGWLCWFLPWRRWRVVLTIGAVWGAAIVLIAPVLLRYRAIQAGFGMRREVPEILAFSADITSILAASPDIIAWGSVAVFRKSEGEIFPGVAALLLIALAIVLVREARASLPSVLRRVRVWLGIGLALFGAATLSALYMPFEFSPFGIRVLAVRNPARPLWPALIALAGIILTGPRLIAGCRRRSVFLFYLLAAIVAWLLCLGPRPEFFGQTVIPAGPYSLLMLLPGIDSLRAPARFAVVTALGLAVAGAIAFSAIVTTLRPARRWIFTAAFLLIGIADFWTYGTAVTPRPEAWPIQFREARGPVLEIPLEPIRDIEAMYRSMYTGNPVVNGYSGYFPPLYGPLVVGLRQHDASLITGIARLGVTQIVLDTSADPDRAWQGVLATLPGAALTDWDGTHQLYTLPAGPPPPPPRLGPVVPVVNVAVNVNPQFLSLMTDGDVNTRWQSGPQTGTEEVVFDVGAARRVGALVTNLGPFTIDYPRRLEIDLSTDGATWTPAWSGRTGGLTLLAMFQEPKAVPLTFELGDSAARFIRLRQLGQDETWYWTIAEFSVHAPLPTTR